MENGLLVKDSTNFQFLVSITNFKFLITNFYNQKKWSQLKKLISARFLNCLTRSTIRGIFAQISEFYKDQELNE
jgi:hypothetical protein